MKIWETSWFCARRWADRDDPLDPAASCSSCRLRASASLRVRALKLMVVVAPFGTSELSAGEGSSSTSSTLMYSSSSVLCLFEELGWPIVSFSLVLKISILAYHQYFSSRTFRMRNGEMGVVLKQ